MMNYVDIAVLAIIVLFVVLGFAGGFLRALISFAGTVAALAVAIMLAQTVANMIGGLFGLKDALGSAFEGMFSGEIFTTPINLSDPASVSAALVSLGLWQFLANPIGNLIAGSAPVGSVETTLAGYVGPMIANLILVIVSFLLLFFVVKLLMSLVEKFIKGLLMNKTIRTGDRFLGAAFGIVKAYFVVCILFTILYYLMPSVEALSVVQEMIDTSTLSKTIYDNNIVLQLLQQIDLAAIFGGAGGEAPEAYVRYIQCL